MYLFSTNSNIELARKICRRAKLRWGRVEYKQLKDGEIYVCLKEKVKGQKVLVVGSTGQPEKNFIELVLLLNSLKVNGAKKIILILPYFGYARQDHLDQPGAPLSAKLMADFIKVTGVDKILTIDLHSEKVVKFFGPKNKHLSFLPFLARQAIKGLNKKNLIVIAPDKGAKKRARAVAQDLKLPLIVVKKYRPEQNVATVHQVAENLKGKDLLIIDDMVDTASTLMPLTQMLKQKGAAKIYFVVTHGILSDPASKRIKQSKVDQLFISDSIPLVKEKRIAKIKVVSLLDFILSKM